MQLFFFTKQFQLFKLRKPGYHNQLKRIIVLNLSSFMTAIHPQLYTHIAIILHKKWTHYNYEDSTCVFHIFYKYSFLFFQSWYSGIVLVNSMSVPFLSVIHYLVLIFNLCSNIIVITFYMLISINIKKNKS